MEELPDFTGLVLHLGLTVPCGETGGESLLIEYSEWRRVDGKLFLAGRVAQTQFQVWIANKEILVAWETVAYCIKFRSRDEYLESVKKHQPTLRERLRW